MNHAAINNGSTRRFTLAAIDVASASVANV